MLIIRLQRTGKKNAADFRIVVAEKTAHASKKITEVLGSYNPRRKVFQINEEKAKYWIGNHTAMSATIHNLFVTKGLVNAPKVKAFSIPKNPPAGGAETAPSQTSAPAAATETPAEAAEATTIMEEKTTPAGEETAADQEVKAE